ncbi:anthranilate synthase component II [Burkholderia stagnalis]|uniref:Glutamine amidotransferase domain-containing protein n=1 Tax=Burkholderia stagnalis TaxID=1503054 RepID=A0A106NQ50_9BURK|nr:aminodeoxychorismate/anthranilate synthase component II [Burkholderia stagnalis]KVZ12100.1 hypothetical protein WT35_14875 [Burkholderia stagnalis]KWA47785.1 hypothetical protein WT42_25080 [Burkholderia stagnalis]KWA49343.1 hypothetical protein WT43_32170 [Burkholderia stagnalis]KWA59347.1 hypothetical protein WT44_00935 [Burkholderia stagnalis]KWD04757.1 hypothetical protein WT45_07610 [Burkholderia stagnalis]
MCNTLIVDNFDSFTYNLFQYMGEVCGEEPDVVLNTVEPDDIDLGRYDCIIISPGPGHPAAAGDVGASVKVIERARVPVLGVCLGHQCMAQMHGMDVVHADEPVHGRISVIQHDNRGVFAGLPADLSVVRYHSLVVRAVCDPFVVTAWGAGGMIHGIRHVSRPLHGIQFHPESICTQAGKALLTNFRDIALAHRAGREVD